QAGDAWSFGSPMRRNGPGDDDGAHLLTLRPAHDQIELAAAAFGADERLPSIMSVRPCQFSTFRFGSRGTARSGALWQCARGIHSPKAGWVRVLMRLRHDGGGRGRDARAGMPDRVASTDRDLGAGLFLLGSAAASSSTI